MNKASLYFKNNHLKHNCKFCGKKISLEHYNIQTLYRYSSINRIPKFCSLKCRAKYYFPKGENHPAYKNGSGKGYNAEFSKPAISILGNHCKKCGTKIHLYAHHIDHNPRNNILSNIMILCSKCHSKLHGKDRRKWKNIKEAWSYHSKQRKIKRQKYLEGAFEKKFGTRIFYTANDLCKKYKVCRERIRQLRNVDRIEYLKIGGRYMYSSKNIDSPKKREKKCLYCHKIFLATHGRCKFCSIDCREIMWHLKRIEKLNKSRSAIAKSGI